MLKKWIIKKFGHTCYFLGRDINGANHFLENARFDCGWYWGGEKPRTNHKLKIYYDGRGAFVRLHGYKIPLDECIRMGV